MDICLFLKSISFCIKARHSQILISVSNSIINIGAYQLHFSLWTWFKSCSCSLEVKTSLSFTIIVGIVTPVHGFSIIKSLFSANSKILYSMEFKLERYLVDRPLAVKSLYSFWICIGLMVFNCFFPKLSWICVL